MVAVVVEHMAVEVVECMGLALVAQDSWFPCNQTL
jgi:hypothetical protein